MPKKSNKTEHVLKLITKNQEGEDGKTEATPDEAIAENENLHDDLKEKLKEELKEELREELKGELTSANTAQESKEDEEDLGDTEEEASEEPEVLDSGPEEEPPNIEETEEKAQEPEPRTEVTKEQQVSRSETPDISFKVHKAAPPISRGKENLHIINLSETLACEMMWDVMQKLNVCTCDLCRADVLAMTLNYLPQKYVTTDAGKQYMQLDMFRKQYETDVLSALTRACVRVKGSPRHEK